MKMTN